jgi:hypothetical protein
MADPWRMEATKQTESTEPGEHDGSVVSVPFCSFQAANAAFFLKSQTLK